MPPAAAQSKLLSVFFAGLASILLYYAFRPGSDTTSTKLLNDLSLVQDKDDDSDDSDGSPPDKKESPGRENLQRNIGGVPDRTSIKTPVSSNVSSTAGEISGTVKNKNALTGVDNDRETSIVTLHKDIEALDKKGKKLFKEGKHLDAAEIFTEALTMISSSIGESEDLRNSLERQTLTLTNNRSAMYEKAQMPDLALHDCDLILEMDAMHTKARTRKLRILESLSRHIEALVEVCALQLKFVQDNRDKLRMGIPVTPPVQQSKIEELMGHILPNEIDVQLNRIKHKFGDDVSRPLPSQHTILQLLQSFTGYNSWMATAAKDDGLDILTSQLDALAEGELTLKLQLLLRRGRRYAYHRKFESCSADFEAAYKVLEENEDVANWLEGDTHARILEWVGTCRHLRYDLEGAAKCYEACADLEPTNSELLVKRAGVYMDGGKLEEGLALFDTALGLDPNAADALLHRANLRMIQQKPAEAKDDLDRCLELCPDHILAWLRLATVLMATDDLPGARKCLDRAGNIDPQSSEVHSYRGEMLFASGEYVEARAEFDRAIECDARNPTPYVNAALAVMNTPTSGGPPNISESIRLLEKAIEIDPQFQTAYIHLGQLKLSMATDLTTAKEVVALYDKGLDYCRTAEELKDIVSMRILTVAQVDAASMLKMDTLNMQ